MSDQQAAAAAQQLWAEAASHDLLVAAYVEQGKLLAALTREQQLLQEESAKRLKRLQGLAELRDTDIRRLEQERAASMRQSEHIAALQCHIKQMQADKAELLAGLREIRVSTGSDVPDAIAANRASEIACAIIAKHEAIGSNDEKSGIMQRLRADKAEMLALLPRLADAIDKLLNGNSCYHYPEEQLMQQARALVAKHAAVDGANS